ncbi:MAG TPA: Ig-like domain-containing protein [Actinomycetes bacterium]|nr:Ig-like domain-containing protein [Actinomycetes bacterium]
MKLLRWVLTGSIAVLAAALCLAGLTFSPAVADSSPPWEPDVQGLGTLTLFDSTGAQVTSGKLSDVPFVSYVSASAPGRKGDIKATLAMATPDHAKPTGQWLVSSLSASTKYPNASAPAPINSFTNPVVTLGPTDGSLQSVIGAQPNTDTTAGYANVYQLRVWTSGIGQPPSGSYFTADIQVDTTAGTWTQIYPTTTLVAPKLTVSASPTKPAYGSARALSVKVTATGTTPTGTVTVKEGTKSLGSATLSKGSAKVSLPKTLSVKKHSLTVSYGGDSLVLAGTATYTLTVVKATGKVSLKAAHSSVSHTAKDKLTITVTATGVVPTGRVTIKDGTKTLKTLTLSKGKATYTLSKLKKGKHSITATYAGSTTVKTAKKTITVTAT